MIKKYIPWAIVFGFAIGWFVDRNTSQVFAKQQENEVEVAYAQGSTGEKDWEAFEISDLIKKRRESKRFYLPFLKRPTMSMGLYSLPKGATDRQPAHGEDEVYYVENGKATLRIGKEDQEVKKGSLVFVKRGIPHRFHSIEEPLDVLVFFSAGK